MAYFFYSTKVWISYPVELLARSLGPSELLIFSRFSSNFRWYIVAFFGVSGVIIVFPIHSFKIFEISSGKWLMFSMLFMTLAIPSLKTSFRDSRFNSWNNSIEAVLWLNVIIRTTRFWSLVKGSKTDLAAHPQLVIQNIECADKAVKNTLF